MIFDRSTHNEKYFMISIGPCTWAYYSFSTPNMWVLLNEVVRLGYVRLINGYVNLKIVCVPVSNNEYDYVVSGASYE